MKKPENDTPEDKVTLSGDAGEDLPIEDKTVHEEKDPLEALGEQLAEKEAHIADLKGEVLRIKADAENYKKRMRKEKEEFALFANEKILKELIHIKDNLERALAADNPTAETLREGVEMILKQFTALMEKEKVEAIEATGKPFDPNLHEALCRVETHEHEENTVTEEYSRGYTLNGRILRPAKVVVAKAPGKKGGKPGDDENGEASADDEPA